MLCTQPGSRKNQYTFQPTQMTKGRVTWQPINQDSGGAPLSDSLGDKETHQSIPVFLWASITMAGTAKKHFHRLLIKGGNKALVFFIRIINQDLPQISKSSPESHKRKITLCAHPSPYNPFLTIPPSNNSPSTKSYLLGMGVDINLDNTAIEQLTFDPTSRDDTEVLCYA